MATKSELRAYAKENNQTLSEARDHFIKLAIKKSKENAKANQIKLVGSSKIQHLPVGSGSAMIFTKATEAKKMMDIIKDDPPIMNTRSNKTDFFSMWNNEEGFLIAVVPVQRKSNNEIGFLGTDASAMRKIVGSMQRTKISENYMMLSTFATSDQAYKIYQKIVNNMGIVFVGYSTPKNLSTLAENVEAVKDWIKDKPCRGFKTAKLLEPVEA